MKKASSRFKIIIKCIIKLVSNIGWHKDEFMFGFDTILPKGCIEEIKILRKIWWK